VVIIVSLFFPLGFAVFIVSLFSVYNKIDKHKVLTTVLVALISLPIGYFLGGAFGFSLIYPDLDYEFFAGWIVLTIGFTAMLLADIVIYKKGKNDKDVKNAKWGIIIISSGFIIDIIFLIFRFIMG